MVSGKNVSFRENSMEKSPSPKRFEEPEGMTDIDLRRLSEMSGYSDSSVRKFDPNTVRNTLFKILAVFLLVGFGTMVFVLIFRQEPIQKTPRIYDKEYNRQEYWKHWNKPEAETRQTSYFEQQQQDETNLNENSNDNSHEDFDDYPSSEFGNNEIHKKESFHHKPSPDTKTQELSNKNNQIDTSLNQVSKIHNSLNTDDDNSIIQGASDPNIENKTGKSNKNTNDKHDFQNSIIDFVSLNLEKLQKCKFEQTVENCCINMQANSNGSDVEPCDVKSIVEAIKKREEEYERDHGSWLRKLLDQGEIKEGLINSEAFVKPNVLNPNLAEPSNLDKESWLRTILDQDEINEGFINSEAFKASNFPKPDITKQSNLNLQKELLGQVGEKIINNAVPLLSEFLKSVNTDSENNNLDKSFDNVFKAIPDFIKLKDVEVSTDPKLLEVKNWPGILFKDEASNLQNMLKASENQLFKVQPDEVHIRTPNFNFDAYTVKIGDPKQLFNGNSDFLDVNLNENPFDNKQESAKTKGFSSFLNINRNNFNTKQDIHGTSKKSLNSVNMLPEINNNLNEKMKDPLEMIHFMNQHLDDFGVIDFFDDNNLDNDITTMTKSETHKSFAEDQLNSDLQVGKQLLGQGEHKHHLNTKDFLMFPEFDWVENLLPEPSDLNNFLSENYQAHRKNSMENTNKKNPEILVDALLPELIEIHPKMVLFQDTKIPENNLEHQTPSKQDNGLHNPDKSVHVLGNGDDHAQEKLIDHIKPNLKKIGNDLLSKFHEIGENIEHKFHELGDKINPTVKEIKTNLISNLHDIENTLEPKLKVLKSLPKMVVEGTGRVMEQIKEDVGALPEGKHGLNANGFHINIDPFKILNRFNPSLKQDDIKDNSNMDVDDESNAPHAEREQLLGNDKNMERITSKPPENSVLKSGVTLQIIQKNRNSLSPIIINGNPLGDNDDKSKNVGEDNTEDPITEGSSEETTTVTDTSPYSDPFQVTTNISEMKTPDINETDVKLDLKETNVNVSYTNTKMKRDAQYFTNPNLGPEHSQHQNHQSEYIPQHVQNIYDTNRYKQQDGNVNYESNIDHAYNQHRASDLQRKHEHSNHHFRHFGQFDYRGEEELGLDTENLRLGAPNTRFHPDDQEAIMNHNAKIFEETRLGQHLNNNPHMATGFYQNGGEQQQWNFKETPNTFHYQYDPRHFSSVQGEYIDHQASDYGLNAGGQIFETRPANEPTQNVNGDHLLQQEHMENFHLASHNVNPPGNNHIPDQYVPPLSQNGFANNHPAIFVKEHQPEMGAETNLGNAPTSFNINLPNLPPKEEVLLSSRQFDDGASKTEQLADTNLKGGEDFNTARDDHLNKEVLTNYNYAETPIMRANTSITNLTVALAEGIALAEDMQNMKGKEYNFNNAVAEQQPTQHILTLASNQHSKIPQVYDNAEDLNEKRYNVQQNVMHQVTETAKNNDVDIDSKTECNGLLVSDSNLEKENDRLYNKAGQSRNFEEKQLGSQPEMNRRISADNKMGQFNSASEDIQSSHHSSLNPNFQKQCIPISPPVGSSLSVIQQQVPYPYDPTPKFTQLIPINVPKPQANSFVINPQYTYVAPNMPQAINGYGTFFTNGQPPVVQQNGPSGQYYICNPISTPNNQVAGIPGVEVRQSGPILGGTLKNNLTTRESDSCAVGHELCADNSKCIKTERICDGEVNCNDGSDEVYCSCKFRLEPSRWCDGYYDCPNGEDEAGCFGCQPGFFNCDDWSYSHGSTCVPIQFRCNGIPDCPTGMDEQDCSALLDVIETSDDIFKVSNNAGFLHRNHEGKWYPVCNNPEFFALDACKYDTGPSVIPPLTRLVPLEQEYRGEYASAGSDNEIHLATKCLEKRAVYVECPQPTCGIRWIYRNPYRREEVDTSAEEIAARFSPRTKREPSNSSVENDLKLEIKSNDTTQDHLNLTESILGDGRVVGGKPCQPGAWPWVVSIYKNGAFHCGGVLISDMWLITAAHCAEKYWLYFYEIELGMLRRFSYSPMQQTRYVTDVIAHPGYDRSNLKNDLAMMRLNHRVKFNRYVRPICLPNEYTAGQYFQNGPLPGTVCTAVGWGATVEHGSDPDHMREVEVPVLPVCKHKEDEEGNEICAGLMEGGKDACQGDSGGPFLCRNPNMPEQWYLAGIVSHGEGCARPNEPGVYTKVAIYRDWIFENAKDDMLPQRKPLHHCPGYTCKAINKCIPKKRRCDRVIDCLYGDDEIDCEHGNSFSSLFKHAMKHMMFSYDGLSRSNVETPGNPATAEAVPEDTISTTFKMENSPITDTLNGNGFAKDDSSFASPAPISDRDEFISNAEAATATSVDVTTEKESVDESPEESISPTTVSNKEDATQPAKTDVNSTVMMKPFKGERFLCRKMLEVIPAEKKCDKTIDCQDGTDEESCACADYLKHSHPEAICDGVTDCRDLSDEKECNASCGGGHFYCRLSKACIPIEKKCDNRPDCDYNEDEWDCFTLADSYRIHLDADSRPALLDSGLLAFNKRDHWVPICMNYTGIEGKIAADACVTLGFNDYEKYLQVEVSNRSLMVGKEEAIVGNDEKSGPCNALYIKCADASVSGHEIGKEDRLNVAGELHTPPWNAAVYADGEYKCAGTVLNLNWILTSVNCFPGILKLHQHYVAVLMGAYKGYLHVGGPHEQVVPVTEAARVLDTEVVLLRLKEKLRFSRYVHPLHFKRTGDFVRHKESCVAIGRDLNQKSSLVMLKPVENCTSGFRCFNRLDEASPAECKVSDAADPWSGCVVCDSGSGFYPAAVFHEPKGWCGFSGSFALPNIALLKRNIFEYMEKAKLLVQPPPCKGYRCNLGECIQAQSMCNGIPDCRDSADEDQAVCEEFKRDCHLTESCYCSPSEMRCGNGKCVEKLAFCDQVDDCGDGSDEPDTCNCQAYLRLANSSKVCDGVRNCLDKSDEDPMLCKCSAGQFKCGQSPYCIPNDMVCDGQRDCPENEDEEKCFSLQSPDDNFNIGEVLTCTSGIWHPGCFPEHLTTTELEEICKKIGFTGNSASYLNTTASTTGRPALDTFNTFWVHRGKGRSKIRLSIRSGARNFVSFVDDPGCHRLFLRCL